MLTAVQRAYGNRHKPAGTYNAWRGMKRRCRGTGSAADRNLYSERGITYCERWHTFANFVADMGERPPGTSLDRINNNGNYEPGNCRWATPREQSNNTRRTRYIEFNGQRLTITQWAAKLGLGRGTLNIRLRNGWPLDKALTTGPTQRGRNSKSHGTGPGPDCPRC